MNDKGFEFILFFIELFLSKLISLYLKQKSLVMINTIDDRFYHKFNYTHDCKYPHFIEIIVVKSHRQ